jgi:hypothetical protein
MVAGGQVFRHPGLQGRHYLLDKLSAFHRDHDSPAAAWPSDLQAAVAHVPPAAYAAAAVPLHEERQRIPAGRRRGPQVLGDLRPIGWARLGVGVVQSPASGEEHSGEPDRAREPQTPHVPQTQRLGKAWRSFGSPTPDTAVWGHSPDVPVGRAGDRDSEREWLLYPLRYPLTPLTSRFPDGPWKLCLLGPP